MLILVAPFCGFIQAREPAQAAATEEYSRARKAASP
jgi:hypothetical protein